MHIIKTLSNLKDAYRVLQIMDVVSCDIKKVDRQGWENFDYWEIKPKHYVTRQQAEDLRKIISYKEHYHKESKLFRKLFYKRFSDGSRDFYYESEPPIT